MNSKSSLPERGLNEEKMHVCLAAKVYLYQTIHAWRCFSRISYLPERGFNEEKNACLSGGKSLFISNHLFMALFFSNFYQLTYISLASILLDKQCSQSLIRFCNVCLQIFLLIKL